LVAGKPLIWYAIAAAEASTRLSAFVTCTDDAEIATVAAACGSPVVRRPAHLAEDSTPMIGVIEYVLQVAAKEGTRPDIVVLLQPTAPQRTAEDIDVSITLLVNSGADSVVSVYQVDDHHPSRMYRLADDHLIPLEKEPDSMLRQALSPVYHRNGAVYACWTSLIEEQKTLLGPRIRPYIMPGDRSANIDTELDLAFADFLLKRNIADG
jgi:CMP-N-acetylneuraminic acid synthetase